MPKDKLKYLGDFQKYILKASLLFEKSNSKVVVINTLIKNVVMMNL